jgi:hypothetical protein
LRRAEPVNPLTSLLNASWNKAALDTSNLPGLPEWVATDISGRKIRAALDPYNIVSPQDLLDADAKIGRYGNVHPSM